MRIGPPRSTVLHILAIEPEDYQLFLCAMPDEPRLPDTFDEWLTESLRAQRIHESVGIKIRRVSIGYDQFVSYCARLGLPRTYALLTTLAMVMGVSADEPGERSASAFKALSELPLPQPAVNGQDDRV